MNQTVRHLAYGVSTGATVFALVVPPIHLLVALAGVVGLDLGQWNNPVEVFVFVITAMVVGVFPWGLWIVLNDAWKCNMFDQEHEVAAYLIASIGVFVILTVLVCTRLQPIYEQFRWFITPALFICAVALLCWRWRSVWRFPAGLGVGGILEQALTGQDES